MMEEKFKWLQQWTDQKSVNLRVLMLIVGCIIIYLVWIILFDHSSSSEEKKLANQIQVIQKKMTEIQQQSDAIIGVMTNANLAQTVAAGKQLTGKSLELKQQLQKKAPFFVTEADLAKFTKDILSEQNNISSANIKNFPEEPWIPSSGIDTSSLPAALSKIYKHDFQIEFKSTYLNTMNYLSRLEALPWHIYWESLDYHVETYPDAQVTLKFYVLSTK